MTETPHQKHARILRDLARKGGDIVAVADGPSPLLEAALRDIVTALLLRLRFKDGGRPLAWDPLYFLRRVREYLDAGMTKDEALLAVSDNAAAALSDGLYPPLGNATTREAKLKRLHKHYATALRVAEADEVIKWTYEADSTRRREIEVEAKERQLQAHESRVAEREARVAERETAADKREVSLRAERDADFIKRNGL